MFKHSLIAFLVAVVCLITSIAVADRTRVMSSASARVDKAVLYRLDDGGASLTACGFHSEADGGPGGSGCYSEDLTGAARTSALGILDGRARTLYLTQEGL